MNSVVYFVLVFLYILEAGSAEKTQDTLCGELVPSLDCSLDPIRKICASNGITYNTSCDYAKAHCLDTSILLDYEGSCEKREPDPICASLVTSICPNISYPICAGDGITYDNFCKFEKSKCDNPRLTLVSLGPCATTAPPTTTTTQSVFDIICESLENLSCLIGQPQVCGSDGVTYDSGCDLEKANCKTDNTISLVREGSC